MIIAELYGFVFVAFFVMMIAVIISTAFPSFKKSAEATQHNLKKYHIALIKEQYRKKFDE